MCTFSKFFYLKTTTQILSWPQPSPASTLFICLSLQENLLKVVYAAISNYFSPICLLNPLISGCCLPNSRKLLLSRSPKTSMSLNWMINSQPSSSVTYQLVQAITSCLKNFSTWLPTPNFLLTAGLFRSVSFATSSTAPLLNLGIPWPEYSAHGPFYLYSGFRWFPQFLSLAQTSPQSNRYLKLNMSILLLRFCMKLQFQVHLSSFEMSPLSNDKYLNMLDSITFFIMFH